MDFKWPCHKRRAHGRHVITEKEDLVQLTERQLFELPIVNTSGHIECPGVKAHPNTMIGTIT